MARKMKRWDCVDDFIECTVESRQSDILDLGYDDEGIYEEIVKVLKEYVDIEFTDKQEHRDALQNYDRKIKRAMRRIWDDEFGDLV